MTGAPQESDSRAGGRAPVPTAAKRPSLAAGLLAGPLAGLFYGLVLAHLAQRGLAPLPVTSQLVYLGLVAGGNVLVGLGAAMIGLLLLRRGSGLRLSGAAWTVLALGLIELHLRVLELGLHPAIHGLVLACVFLGARLLLARLAPLFRWLGRPHILAAADLVGLLAFAMRVAGTRASDHGAPTWTLALWLPAALLLALGLGLATRGRGPRLLAAAAALAGLVLAALSLHAPSDRPTTAAHPNVLIVTVDTLRADHLGCYGATEVPTPAIDALAAEGVLFEQAISPIPTTNPAHSSLFTGLDPGDHGVINNAPYAFFPEVRTLPELLAHEVYRTAAFVSGYTLKRPLAPVRPLPALRRRLRLPTLCPQRVARHGAAAAGQAGRALRGPALAHPRRAFRSPRGGPRGRRRRLARAKRRRTVLPLAAPV